MTHKLYEMRIDPARAGVVCDKCGWFIADKHLIDKEDRIRQLSAECKAR